MHDCHCFDDLLAAAERRRMIETKDLDLTISVRTGQTPKQIKQTLLAAANARRGAGRVQRRQERQRRVEKRHRIRHSLSISVQHEPMQMDRTGHFWVWTDSQ